MQILNNQSIIVQNLLYYKCVTHKKDIWDIIDHINKHIETIGLHKTGQTITSIEDIEQSDCINLEVLTPIDSSFEEKSSFSFLPQFKLLYAVKIRHEGNIGNLTTSQKILEEYLEAHSYEAITKYYNVIVRHDSDIMANSIIDIYVGINPNIINSPNNQKISRN